MICLLERLERSSLHISTDCRDYLGVRREEVAGEVEHLVGLVGDPAGASAGVLEREPRLGVIVGTEDLRGVGTPAAPQQHHLPPGDLPGGVPLSAILQTVRLLLGQQVVLRREVRIIFSCE